MQQKNEFPIIPWFILDAIEPMNLQEFYEGLRPDGVGGTSFPPTIMVPLLVYAYCVGVRSSRQIERLCERDVAFRVIAANHVPDCTTIARFRKDYEEALGKLFGQVLALCAEAGLMKVGVVALDGTKMEANASLAANGTAEGIERQVRKILEEAAVADVRDPRARSGEKKTYPAVFPLGVSDSANDGFFRRKFWGNSSSTILDIPGMWCYACPRRRNGISRQSGDLCGSLAEWD